MNDKLFEVTLEGLVGLVVHIKAPGQPEARRRLIEQGLYPSSIKLTKHLITSYDQEVKPGIYVRRDNKLYESLFRIIGLPENTKGKRWPAPITTVFMDTPRG
jgi:hypothetical protein